MGKFRKLISWKHFSGILLFLLIITGYYFAYYLKNPNDIGTLLYRIISESTDKSAIGTGIIKTAMHIIKFPIELIFHFAPWTLFFVFLFSKAVIKRMLANPFIKYCGFAFLANIIVYWLSPTTYPRYLLMLLPFLFIVFIYSAKFHAYNKTWLGIFIGKLLFGTVILLIVTNVVIAVYVGSQIYVSHIYIKAIILTGTGVLALYFTYFKNSRSNLIFALAIMLLISRITFNLFIFPYRQSIMWPNACRQDAIILAWGTMGKDLYFNTDTITIPNAYYITRERNKILRFSNQIQNESFYIVDDTTAVANFKVEFCMRIPMKYKKYYAGRFFSETQ